MTDDAVRCFRCEGVWKIMMTMRIDDKPIFLCANCYRDFSLFLEGYVVNPMVKYTDKRKVSE